MFSVLYDQRALALCTLALLIALLTRGAVAVADRGNRAVLVRAVALLVLSTAVRVVFWHRGVIRTADMLLNLGRFFDGRFFDLKYPVSFGAMAHLVTWLHAFPPGRPAYGLAFGILLVVGSLTPPVLYLVAREVSADARVAFVVGLMAALNPVHVIFCGHYDFYALSVFYDSLTQLFLLRHLRTHRLTDLATFVLASYLFCNSRVENNAVFYVNTLLLILTARGVKAPRLQQGAILVFYVVLHLMVQLDWSRGPLKGQHMVTDLPLAPLRLAVNLFDPRWNHLLDVRFCPPYLLPLVAAGLYAAWRRSEIAGRFEATLLVSMLLLYSNITDSTALWNARYFLNILPPLLLVAAGGLGYLEGRFPRWRAWSPWVVIACFLLYVPMLARFGYLTQDEYRFYRDEVRPRLHAGVTVWNFAIPEPWFDWEYRDPHLFAIDGFRVVHDPEQLRSGDLLYLGINCYQMLDRPLPMRPECAAQLADPRNAVVLRRRFAARPFHIRAPWYVHDVWRTFQHVDLYVLRRR